MIKRIKHPMNKFVFMEDKVISIFCLIDNILKKMGYVENEKRGVKDSEVLTIAIVSAMNLYGHHERSIPI
jgi:hypothetical protein